MPTTDSQPTSPAMEFARTISHWCATKFGFQEWLLKQVAVHCKYMASRYEKAKSNQQDSCERPFPPFDGDSLSLGEIAAFAVDRFNRLNAKSQIAPEGLTGTANHFWILSQIHECDLPQSHPNAKDLAHEIRSAKIKEFTSTLEDAFSHEAFPDLFTAPRSTIEELIVLARNMRVVASGELADVVAGVLGELRNWYYKAGGIVALPIAPDSTTVNQSGVIEWLNAFLDACEPRVETGERPATNMALSNADAQNNAAMARLLRVLTNRVSDERIVKAISIMSKELTANEKLTEIDALLPIPATASAEQLGELIGVTKQAVIKTKWWIDNRKGEKQNEIGRRQAKHRERAEGSESDIEAER
jgi:hypothetical protein